MLWTIDPDVFHAAKTDWNCKNALIKIAQMQGECMFVVDGGTIESEYLSHFQALLLKQDPSGSPNAHFSLDDHLTLQLLQRILEGEDGIRLEIDSTYTVALEHDLRSLGCMTSVEPELLAMVSRSRDHHPTVLLAGPDATGTNLRNRGMYIPQTHRRIWNKWPWFETEYASETIVQFSHEVVPPENRTAHRRSREFEGKVALYLNSHFADLPCFQIYATPLVCGVPPSPEKEDIDVYGRIEDEERLTVLVGECKLRNDGNEEKLIKPGTINQAHRIVGAVRRYEKQHHPGCSIEVIGFVISNAVDLEPDAWFQANELGIRYLRASLTSGWSRADNWSIRSLEEMTSQIEPV